MAFKIYYFLIFKIFKIQLKEYEYWINVILSWFHRFFIFMITEIIKKELDFSERLFNYNNDHINLCLFELIFTIIKNLLKN